MSNYKTTIKNRIWVYVKANCLKIDDKDFIIGDMNYTYKCHLNAVHKYHVDNSYEVYSCLTIWKDSWSDMIVHFINRKDGRFQDNTWGYLHKDYDYYLIRQIEPSEFDKIGNRLTETKKFLVNSNSNSFLRKLFKTSYTII